jgi:hypothetical protein
MRITVEQARAVANLTRAARRRFPTLALALLVEHHGQEDGPRAWLQWTRRRGPPALLGWMSDRELLERRQLAPERDEVRLSKGGLQFVQTMLKTLARVDRKRMPQPPPPL